MRTQTSVLGAQAPEAQIEGDGPYLVRAVVGGKERGRGEGRDCGRQEVATDRMPRDRLRPAASVVRVAVQSDVARARVRRRDMRSEIAVGAQRSERAARRTIDSAVPW